MTSPFAGIVGAATFEVKTAPVAGLSIEDIDPAITALVADLNERRKTAQPNKRPFVNIPITDNDLRNQLAKHIQAAARKLELTAYVKDQFGDSDNLLSVNITLGDRRGRKPGTPNADGAPTDGASQDGNVTAGSNEEPGKGTGKSAPATAAAASKAPTAPTAPSGKK